VAQISSQGEAIRGATNVLGLQCGRSSGLLRLALALTWFNKGFPDPSRTHHHGHVLQVGPNLICALGLDFLHLWVYFAKKRETIQKEVKVRGLKNAGYFVIVGFFLVISLVTVSGHSWPSQPPTLVLFAPEIQGLTVRINGVALPGSPGTVISRIHWDWGDGFRGDQWFVASHTYASPGTYTVTVTAFQSDGLSTTKTVTVYLAGGQPPSLTLFNPEIRGLTVTINGVTLPGTPGTTIVRIQWDWGDGIREDRWFAASHTYSRAGTYTVTVTSFQSDGLSTTRTVTVSLKEENKPPVVDFSYSPPTPRVNETIQFTDRSYDPDGSITSWRWEFGDGSTSTLSNPSHSYSRPGTYTVWLYVTDNGGAAARASKTITVGEANRPPYYLFPVYLNLTVGETSSVQLRVIDRDGNIVSERITFEYDPSFISVSADGRVTSLREEQPGEAGTTVGASVNGVPVSNRTVIRVLSTNYRIPYRWVVGNHVAWYFPEEIKGENLSRFVEQYEILRASEIAYEIQSRLLNLQPFNGALQIFEVEIQEEGKFCICGVAGMNPIRLGWTITGNEWKNCFLVPYISPRAPHWGVFFHELGHNFLLASENFHKTLGKAWVYLEAIATAMGLTTMRFLLSGPYSLGAAAVSSMEMLAQQDEQRMLDKFQKWLQAGADFKVLEQVPGPGPDIVDGMWLYYRNQRPFDFAKRFFTPLRPQYYKILEPIINKMRPGDEHTIFAALVSAALGQDLSLTFLQDYHYPLNISFFNEAYHVFLTIICSVE